MEPKEMLALLRKGWMTLTCVVLLAVSAGAAYFLAQPKSYSATTELFVSVKSLGEDGAGEVVQGSSAAQLKVKSYVKVVTSSSVLGPVIKELGLSTTPAALSSRISAVTPANTVLIDITVTDPDPAQAAKIANAVGAQTAKTIIEDIEAPSAGGESPVQIGTIEPAVAPQWASSPRLGVIVPLSVLGGIMAGIAFLLLRNALDTRMHGPTDVAEITDTPVIGTIGFDPNAGQAPLVVHEEPRSPRAESFRALRTNLQFLDVGTEQRTFVVTSAVPGEGKSTTTANLAIAIAESGASVIVIDCDLRRPRMAEVLGIDGTVGVTDALIGRAELDDLIQPWGRNALAILPAGAVPPNPSELLGSLGMRALIAELSARYDYVLIDAPPLLPVTDAAIISRFVRGAIMVNSVRRATKSQFREAIATLDRIESRLFGVVMTMLPETGPNRYGYGSYNRYYGDAPQVVAEPQPTVTARRAKNVTA